MTALDKWDVSWIDQLTENELDWLIAHLDKKGISSPYDSSNQSFGLSKKEHACNRLVTINSEGEYRKIRQSYRQFKYRKSSSSKSRSYTLSNQAITELDKLRSTLSQAQSRAIPLSNSDVIEHLIHDTYNGIIDRKRIERLAQKQLKHEKEIEKLRYERVNFGNARMAELKKRAQSNRAPIVEQLTEENENLCQELEGAMNENALLKHKIDNHKSYHDEVISENGRLKSEIDQLKKQNQALLEAKKRLDL
ncbi:hypothetical protein P3593_11670 [Vibrio parahaemolyticus]|uniref:hypothetical protein n=1 Tax=Vibrio sp. 1863 TaxID=3074579 RepID=UPI0023EA7A0F|nr:hypothetical protein [Vibrio sp. 1863]MDF5056388.1 hypothetical protein [Vibrio parahaemolyticus]MDW2076237.1 hypothetical protein [Vibrio sp. 1863]